MLLPILIDSLPCHQLASFRLRYNFTSLKKVKIIVQKEQNNRELLQPWRRFQQQCENKKDFMSKLWKCLTPFGTFLWRHLTSTTWTFYEGREHRATNFLFFLNLDTAIHNSTPAKFRVQYVVLGPRLKVINLNILPESSLNELKYSQKIAFMLFSIILKFQVPDINILLGIGRKATVFDGPWSANMVLRPRLR